MLFYFRIRAKERGVLFREKCEFYCKNPGAGAFNLVLKHQGTNLEEREGAYKEYGRKATEEADIKKAGNLTSELRGLTVMHVTWCVRH